METNNQYSGKQKTVKTKLNNMTDYYKVLYQQGVDEAKRGISIMTLCIRELSQKQLLYATFL